MAFGDDAVLTATASGGQVNILLSATGMTSLTIYRRTALSSSTIVRGAKQADVLGPGFWAGGDFEAPQGQALEYRASITDGVTVFEVPPVSALGTVDYEGDFLSPVGQPFFGRNVTVEKGGVGDLTRDVIRDVQPVLNRASPVAVSYGRSFWRGEFTFLTLTDQERKDFLKVMNFPVVYFSPREGYGFEDGVFLSPGAVTEIRTSGLGSEGSRRWTVEFTQVDRPPPGYPYTVIGDTWQIILDRAVTWQVILYTEVNFLDLAGYGDGEGGFPARTGSALGVSSGSAVAGVGVKNTNGTGAGSSNSSGVGTGVAA